MTDKQYSPEYLADRKLERRVQQAQRARVWTAAYAAALPKFIHHTGSAEDIAKIVARHAREAVEQFDKAWEGS